MTFATPTCIPNKKNTTCTCAKVAATVGIPWDEGCASTEVELHRPTRSLPEITLAVVGVGEFFLRGVFQSGKKSKSEKQKQDIFWCFFGNVKVSSIEFEMIDFDVWASVSVSKGGGTQQ